MIGKKYAQNLRLYLSHVTFPAVASSASLPLSAAARDLFLKLVRRAKGGPLFTDDDGRALTVRRTSHRFSVRARKAGFPALRFHDLRHTFGTRLGEAGASPYEIARLMGHGQINTSMIYVHPSTANLRRTLDAVSHYPDTERSQKAG